MAISPLTFQGMLPDFKGIYEGGANARLNQHAQQRADAALQMKQQQEQFDNGMRIAQDARAAEAQSLVGAKMLQEYAHVEWKNTEEKRQALAGMDQAEFFIDPLGSKIGQMKRKLGYTDKQVLEQAGAPAKKEEAKKEEAKKEEAKKEVVVPEEAKKANEGMADFGLSPGVESPRVSYDFVGTPQKTNTPTMGE